jgi:GAF domain-containing protein
MKGTALDTTMTLTQRLERIERLAAEMPPVCGVLRGELQALRSDVVLYEAGRHALHGELAAREAESQRLASSLAEAQRREMETASLYVATHRLHASLDRGRVLQALEEIVGSLLGCEEMAVFELVGTPPVLAPVRLVGLAAAPERVLPGVGMIGQVAVSGEVWIAEREPWVDEAGRPLTACIPLTVDGRVTGVVVLYRLLEHEGRLRPSDRPLLELLGTHAGTALCATRLHMRHGNGSCAS